MNEARELTEERIKEALKYGILMTLFLMGAAGFVLWNVFQAARDGRILHTGKISKTEWVALREHPGFFWYDVVTSLMFLLVLGWLMFMVFQRVRWLLRAKSRTLPTAKS